MQGKGRQNQWHLPDLVALCEVENDSAMIALTKRSLLRKAGYEYVMTSSPDERGIDVALMYQPFSFRLLHHHALCQGNFDGERYASCFCSSCPKS